jgi:ATP-binding protein involved in chromosome partitioning
MDHSPMLVDNDYVLGALKKVQDPDIGKDIVSLDMVHDIKVDGGKVSLTIESLAPLYPKEVELANTCRATLLDLPGVEEVDLQTRFRVTTAPRTDNKEILPEVKNTVAIASGKGGVGKSTVAVNVAVHLARMGAKVGLLDADIYGPSIPKMTGVEGKMQLEDSGSGKPAPPEAHGIKIVSIGFFVDEDQPVIWRGPMAHQALRQFLTDFEWGELDYLILDLPPGTGDIQLTLVQSIPLTGALIVCTPQDVALLDATKGLKMFQQVQANIFGIVENMSWYVCPHCGERADIFSHGGAKAASDSLNVGFLGEIPIDIEVRIGGDAGTPYMAGEKDDTEVGKAYIDLCQNLVSVVKKNNDAASGTGFTINIKR